MGMCVFPAEGDPRVCELCQREVRGAPSGPVYAMCRAGGALPVPERGETRIHVTGPSKGPGRELERLLDVPELKNSCDGFCASRVLQMDKWGADECRRRVSEIAGWLRTSFGRLPLAGKIKALRAIGPLVGDWVRPFEALVELAIAISEAGEFSQHEITAAEISRLEATLMPLRYGSEGIVDALAQTRGGSVLTWIDDGADLSALPIEPIRGPGGSRLALPGGGYLRRPTRPMPRPGKLIRIEQSAGFGDAVELSAILRHLRHYYPRARLEVVVEPSRAALYSTEQPDPAIGRPLVDRVMEPSEARFITHPLSAWPGHSRSFARWPSSPVEHCLVDRFGLQPIPELCHYWCPRPASVASPDTGRPMALCHFAGRHRQAQKNLSIDQRSAVHHALIEAGYDVWELGQDVQAGDARRLAELIVGCDLFLGVDSGPLHYASALAQRAIGLWTYLSPLHCFCPDATTTHLLWRGPAPDYERWRLCNPVADGLAFFRAHYAQAWCDDFGDGVSRLLA